jgi:hypothetical protein
MRPVFIITTIAFLTLLGWRCTGSPDAPSLQNQSVPFEKGEEDPDAYFNRFVKYAEADSVNFSIQADTLFARVLNSKRVAKTKQKLGRKWKGTEAIASVFAAMSGHDLKKHNLRYLSIWFDDTGRHTYSAQTIEEVQTCLVVVRRFLKLTQQKDFEACAAMFEKAEVSDTERKLLTVHLQQMFPATIKREPELQGFSKENGFIALFIDVTFESGIHTYGFAISPEKQKLTALYTY